MTDKNRSIFGLLLFSLAFVVICIIRYSEFAFILPYGIHEGAQSDRLALAIGFYDNGMNFFLPRTYHIDPIDAVTPTEFPLQSYLAACLGHIFGRDSISVCFRMLTLCFSYAGLTALYLTCFKATKDIVTSFFVPFFLLASPAFAYYACNYLPDAAAVSVSFIGVLFYHNYQTKKTFKSLVWAMLLFTLATLMKTTLGIVLLATMGYTLINLLFFEKNRNLTTILRTLLLFGISLVPIVAYYFYNQHLAKEYDAHLFLMRTNPFANKESMRLYFKYSIRHTYINEYYIVLQYPFLAMIYAAGLYSIMVQKQTRKILSFLIIIFTGCIAATFLFGEQMIHHDYYFVSIWHPAITITMLLFIIQIRKNITVRHSRIVFNIAGAAAILVILFFSNNYFKSRVTLEDYRYPGLKKALPTNWMNGGAEKLDKLSISRDSTILVLDEEPPNVGLVYFDRSGVNMSRNWWPGDITKVKSCMKQYGINIMVCDARKMQDIKTTYDPKFSELFTELYIDDFCAVYCLK